MFTIILILDSEKKRKPWLEEANREPSAFARVESGDKFIRNSLDSFDDSLGHCTECPTPSSYSFFGEYVCSKDNSVTF
jgi:hypothetical protein